MHILDQVLKEDLPNSRKSVAGAPKMWPGELQKAPDRCEKEAKRRLNEALNASKVSEKENKHKSDENVNVDDPLERNARF